MRTLSRTLLLSLVATSASGWLSPLVHPARRTCCVMLSDDDLSSFTVPQLKEKLRAAQLPVSGRKAELIARLRGAPTAASAAATPASPASPAASPPPASPASSPPVGTFPPRSSWPKSGRVNSGSRVIFPTNVPAAGYVREAGDTAPVDVEAVHKILSERDEARAARDWNRADALRDTLADAHGVTVQDNEQTWFVGGRAGGGGPAGGGRQRGRESGRRNRESRYERAGFEQGRYDGGYAGYDGGRGDRRYDGGDTGSAGYARGGREPGRYGGGYAGYDGGGAGQRRYVPPAGGSGYSAYDTGYSRGTGYDAYEDQYEARGYADERRARRRERDARRMQTRRAPYARAPECEASLEEAQVREITDLVNRRLRKKLDRRFDEADDLLRLLEGSYGVTVSDDARQWRADGLSFVYAYRRDGGDGGRDAAEVGAVEDLLRERGVAKSRKQYAASDAILEELRALGVDVDDKARSWWFVGGGGGGGYGGGRGGTFAARGGGAGYSARDGYGSSAGRGRSGWVAGRAQLDRSKLHDYSRSHTDDYALRAEQLDRIDELLGRRLAAKRARDFERADQLQAELRQLGVEVDDRARQWYVRYGDGERTASSYNVRGR